MLKKILSRGGPAAGYLVIRFFKSVTLLAAIPISLILGWLIPGATAGLVRLANSERRRAARFLGGPVSPSSCRLRCRACRVTW